MENEYTPGQWVIAGPAKPAGKRSTSDRRCRVVKKYNRWYLVEYINRKGILIREGFFPEQMEAI